MAILLEASGSQEKHQETQESSHVTLHPTNVELEDLLVLSSGSPLASLLDRVG